MSENPLLENNGGAWGRWTLDPVDYACLFISRVDRLKVSPLNSSRRTQGVTQRLTTMPWRKRARDTNEQDNNGESTGNGAGEASGYENFRNQRIKENMERMQKLGIPDLSQKLKSKTAPPKPTPKNPTEKKTQNPLPLPGSPRRSSRYFFFSLEYVWLVGKWGKEQKVKQSFCPFGWVSWNE